MSEKDPIRVFVAHLFEEDVDYLRAFEYMESRDRFFYLNTAKPDDMPQGGAEAIKTTLREQIQGQADVERQDRSRAKNRHTKNGSRQLQR